MPDLVLHYLTHPQVVIEPDRPVPEWGLSDVGRARAGRIAGSPWIAGLTRIVSSPEVKALETARPIAAACGLSIEVDPESHENDRSSTGFLPPPAFEAMADRFFDCPEESQDGWERAVDAADRIGRAAERAMAGLVSGRVLMVGHGAVGTLLAYRLAGRPISRRFDQPAGGGNLWTALWPSGTLVHDWIGLEAAAERQPRQDPSAHIASIAER